MKTRWAQPLMLPLMLLLAAPLLADDKAEPKDDTPYLEGDKQTLKEPPIQALRPSDSWQFVDLEKMKKKAQEQGADLSGYQGLRFRLYYPAKRADVYIWAWIDESEPDKALTAEKMAEMKVTQLKAAFKEPKLAKPYHTRVGRQVGVGFELSGELAAQPKVQRGIVCTVATRSEDRCAIVVQLECHPDQLKELTKDLKKLLKKLKF
ncbi:MAG: hypothetical protein AB7N76_12145 [Planctomycetota bacterium]